MSFIEFKHVTKDYDMGTLKCRAIDDISFKIEKGEFVIILGPSGAGKSTLLNLLGGLDYVSDGSILIDGDDITKYDEDDLTTYRKDAIGFVFQFYNLIPSLTAYENVSLIKAIKKDSLDAIEALELVGLSLHRDKFPSQLSGGEQQRVSIARAICKNPKLLLCDEPTGALDTETGLKVLELLQKLSRQKGQTVIVVTHNDHMACVADRVIRMRNGKISEIIMNQSPLPVEEVKW
ncbi:MAG: ABC transporter ATP-binding protein [Clostridiales bacterium]|jgi:putative ABC transport system ATP-binding protein|nr:ABC transporter ATP-binding protein [Clostridiales bacterium]